jgi:hypothetical protein
MPALAPCYPIHWVNLVICDWVIAEKPFDFQISQYQITQLPNLLNLFVRCVLAATLAKLAVLKTAGRGLLVLGRRVIPFFALVAL